MSAAPIEIKFEGNNPVTNNLAVTVKEVKLLFEGGTTETIAQGEKLTISGVLVGAHVIKNDSQILPYNVKTGFTFPKVTSASITSTVTEGSLSIKDIKGLGGDLTLA